jgi:N-acetylglucosaminyldiphosphoundecaprenol N-acetyl-beta-D-mannosaminyltransferase
MKVNASEGPQVGRSSNHQTSLVCIEDGRTDNLSRDVFGVLGLPIDVIDLESLLRKIDAAVSKRSPFLLSTPNVNFLMMSRSDECFRETLLMSDLCPVDGMPLVWISRLLGIPLQQRLSGSDIFDKLRSRAVARKLKVFLFGGAEGVAATVGEKLNKADGGLICVGALNPGFGSVQDMSSHPIVQSINSSKADLLTVFLSARKAQHWLSENHSRIDVPVRVQLGTTVNLQAGIVRRAPPMMRELGLEWLWRIREEPYLWRRYSKDGVGLLFLVLTKVLVLALEERLQRSSKQQLQISCFEDSKTHRLKLLGPAISSHIEKAITSFRNALAARKAISIDLSGASAVDARFFGLFMMLRKETALLGCGLQFVNLPPRIRRKFRRNGFEFLLEA